jgi:hypothetical protein
MLPDLVPAMRMVRSPLIRFLPVVLQLGLTESAKKEKCFVTGVSDK